MNKFLQFLLITILGWSLPVLAQKKLTEGTISYDIIINTGSDKAQAADLLDGAVSTVYIKGPKSRTDMVSSLGSQSTIIDDVKKAVTIIKEYGDQKYIITLTPDDWRDVNRRYENVSFSFSNDTKKIAGYTCKKAVGKLPDGTTFTVWYTPELVPENKDFQYANRSLPGLAMEYETTMGSLKVTYTVSKISFSPVPAAKFDIPRSGYRIMTYQESKGKG